MKISDVEINRRMELLDLKNDDLQLLRSHKLLIEESLDLIVNEFYAKQTAIDEIALLIGDADTLQRLQMAQRTYVLDLFSGHFDTEYVNNRLRIGLIHKRIGVEPKLYLSAVYTLKKIIREKLKTLLDNEEVFYLTLDALDKLFYFDVTFVFDTYIDSLVEEIKTAQRRTEAYAPSLENKVAERTKQLEEMAKIDPLTGVCNQRAMAEWMRREMAVAKRNLSKLVFVYLDVDNFKLINDTHGHIKGDEVLKAIGRALLNNIREIDIVCRCDGDEFCIILPNCDIENSLIVCKKIIAEFEGKYPEFSLSIGISQTGEGAYISTDQLIKEADEKMYLAKKENGSHIKV
jgi:diguanylate cyclase (GGDEF)-like protein